MVLDIACFLFYNEINFTLLHENNILECLRLRVSLQKKCCHVELNRKNTYKNPDFSGLASVVTGDLRA